MKLVVLIGILFLGSCSTYKSLRYDGPEALEVGLTSKEVAKKFGTPESNEVVNGINIKGYWIATSAFKSRPYYLQFKDGNLVGWYIDTDLENRRAAHLSKGFNNMSKNYNSTPTQQAYQIPKRKSADCVSQTDHFGVTRTKCTEN